VEDRLAWSRTLTRWRPSPWLRRWGRRVILAGAVFGVIAGIWAIYLHVTTDPLADVRAYYDAGARLNAGLPLYPADANTDTAEFYRYPPLLAILFRPLALLPYELVALGWGALMLGAFMLTVRTLGIDERSLLAIAILALPIGWSIVIGQAQVAITLLVSIGTPAAVALAANLKLFPALVGVYWLGRRDWRSLGKLIGWGLGLLGIQFILEPAGTIAFLGFPDLEQVGEVNNLSPYRISPALWAALVVAGFLIAVRLAPTRWGWAAAVTFSVLVTPRLLVYQLMALLPAIRDPHVRANRPAQGQRSSPKAMSE
jgi:hypothetical protein